MNDHRAIGIASIILACAISGNGIIGTRNAMNVLHTQAQTIAQAKQSANKGADQDASDATDSDSRQADQDGSRDDTTDDTSSRDTDDTNVDSTSDADAEDETDDSAGAHDDIDAPVDTEVVNDASTTPDVAPDQAPTAEDTTQRQQPTDDVADAAAQETQPRYKRYVVQDGDTLSKISYKTGVSVDAIANANEIRNVNMIYRGSVLLIPQP